ncbi:MAG TPA: LysM peptidoglycan-binding domain-containing protein [Oculatellaceae cyanobacterium]|jgi:nucleoid-associated protein YgaU
MASKEFEHGFGEERNMPSDVHEKTPGVYVRAENELPHELDMLWSNSKAYQREDRSPIIPFIAGVLTGAILTGTVFMLFLNQPKIQTGSSELEAPISESITPATDKEAVSGGRIEKAPDTMMNSTTYKVVSGDTLGRIAEKVYGSSAPKYIEKIQRANNMSSPDSLQIGQKLVIPPKDY